MYTVLTLTSFIYSWNSSWIWRLQSKSKRTICFPLLKMIGQSLIMFTIVFNGNPFNFNCNIPLLYVLSCLNATKTIFCLVEAFPLAAFTPSFQLILLIFTTINTCKSATTNLSMDREPLATKRLWQLLMGTLYSQGHLWFSSNIVSI